MWKRLNLSLSDASRSAVGVWHGPPKALEGTEPCVVDQNDQDVRGASRRPQRLDRRKRRVRILRIDRQRAR